MSLSLTHTYQNGPRLFFPFSAWREGGEFLSPPPPLPLPLLSFSAKPVQNQHFGAEEERHEEEEEVLTRLPTTTTLFPWARVEGEREEQEEEEKQVSLMESIQARKRKGVKGRRRMNPSIKRIWGGREEEEEEEEEEEMWMEFGFFLSPFFLPPSLH